MFLPKYKKKAEELEKRVKELEDYVVQLENNLLRDPLTGLRTRAFFEQEVGLYLSLIRIQDELAKNNIYKRKEDFGFKNLSIIFFDIDHFKKINDTYGHEVGDEVLRIVAQTIKAGLRTSDTTARWGGEEILSSLLGADESDAKTKAEEIRKKVEALEFPEFPGLKTTVSAGVASTENSLALFELVKHADDALYRAKETGRNKVISYSEIF
jgi:diguanylate cyclase (GGDEF)-like protein